MYKTVWTALAAGIIGAAGVAYAASFGDIDANGDGVITQDEFATAYPEAGQEAWTQADVNQDGQLSEDEHQAAVDAGVLPAEE